MEILLGIVLSLLSACCIFLVVLGLPGTWLMAGMTALAAWWRWNPQQGWSEQFIGLPGLAIVFGLALLGEFWEFAASAAGAKKAGASGWGSFGALLGALIGGIAATFFIPIPIVGSLIGACGGAAAGAWIFELGVGREHHQAVRSGIGAGIGKLRGMLAKLGAAAAMWLAITISAFV